MTLRQRTAPGPHFMKHSVDNRLHRASSGQAAVTVGLGCAALAWGMEAVLESPLAGPSLLSSVSLASVAQTLGGESQVDSATQMMLVDVPYFAMLLITALVTGVAILGLCAERLIARRIGPSQDGCSDSGPSVIAITDTLARAWRWWWGGGVLVVVDGLLLMFGADTGESLLMANAPHVVAIALAGWAATLLTSTRLLTGRRMNAWVWAAMLLYVVVFTAMNWQLYRTLMLPHGDSAMYEEHLWNLTHGKGFRSYLDQGLFFGEHIQVVHLLLLPLYVFWPSHLLLELCQSVALAAGALPVFWMARRASNDERVGCLIAVAYLLYPPMQFLDIAIDFKTFRPEAFVVPAYLFALDQFERRRFKTALVCMLIGLSAKEDYAIVLAPFGVWWAVSAFAARKHALLSPTREAASANSEDVASRSVLSRRSCDESVAWASSPCSSRENSHGQEAHTTKSESRHWLAGIGLVVFAVAYLLVATRIAMPYFRSGNELHYVSYFSKFGKSFGEVVLNMLTRPLLVLSELTSAPSIMYLLAVFVPLGFVVLRSPGRALVSAPLLVLLCLNEVIRQDPFPRHHFQAPVVPLLFWAVTGALASNGSERFRLSPRFLAAFVFSSSLLASITAGQSPLGLRFWDPGSVAYWKLNYSMTRRAELVDRVLAVIPPTAKVASTDFVHPRLTHYERSYDYSHYPRAVANYEDRVPDDTDYIVIDTGHRYSDIKTPEQVRELQREPEKWELLDLKTEGVFIVLKRRR